MRAREVDGGMPRQKRGHLIHFGRKPVKGRMTNADKKRYKGREAPVELVFDRLIRFGPCSLLLGNLFFAGIRELNHGVW